MVPTADRSAFTLLAWVVAVLYLTCAGVEAAEPAPEKREVRETETSPDTLAALSPRTAMLRSAILPGWGQYSNHRPLKALLFAAAATASLGSAVAEARSLDRAATPEEHQDRAARRNTRFLFFAVTATLAAVDAYVDAHLADLESVELKLSTRPRLHSDADGGGMTTMVQARIRL